jgi:hypothetical protein
MMEWIDSADDIVALKLADKIGGADLDAIMDRLDTAMARHETVHIFLETCSIDGIELSGLGSYVVRALPLLGKLGRFGRVAVVADQAWIRAGTRIESALLPGISYRTFTPEQRDEAFDWVTGTTVDA